MKRTIGVAISVVLFAFLAADGRLVTGAAAADADPHTYFDALVKRSDHWKSYSLRSADQMLEYRRTRTRPMNVTYDPANDRYPDRQDAAKVSVPEFDPEPFSQLAKPLKPGDTSVVLTATDVEMSSRLANQRSLRIGPEIMTIVRESGKSLTNGTVDVIRGQLGTSPTSHTAGASVLVSMNIAFNNARLPLGTEDGNSYLFTWDAWYGPEFDFDNAGIGNYKTFQFGAPDYFFQVDTIFSDAVGDDLATIGAHSYPTGRPIPEAFGPNIISHYPVKPQVGQLNVRPATWTRYWVQIDQKASDWDPLTMWVADEKHDAVKIFDRLQYEVPGSITQFILEFATSTNKLQARGTMVAYVRNFVALRNPPRDPSSLFLRPLAGAPPREGDRPSAPRNLRIVR
jgi:hypothetical protein